MADPTVVLRRMQKARARAEAQRLEVAAALGPAAAVVVAASPAGGEVQAVAGAVGYASGHTSAACAAYGAWRRIEDAPQGWAAS